MKQWRRSTFRLPILIALLCFTGLVTALLGDGWWDVMAWIGLGIPAVVGGWGLLSGKG